MSILSLDEFLNLARTEAQRDLSRTRQRQQLDAVTASRAESLFLVAGPGTGKTTVLALRVLKLVFVDDIEPSGIVATTFTKKAAAELRSRILGWGDRFRNACLRARNLNQTVRSQIERLDLNRIVTGTLDSIAETILGECRAPGTQPPVVVEEFVAHAFMLRDGLFPHNGHRNADLRNYLTVLRGTAWGLQTPEVSRTMMEIRERIIHDSVDAVRYEFDPRTGGTPPDPAVGITCRVISDYISKLQGEMVLDYAALEQQFLLQMQTGALNAFVDSLQAVLVDEYQDTNLLQEQIYFELARPALAHGGGLTVVGDDDQSLYRFRGATVDLFQNFQNRTQRELNLTPRLIYLSQNYRSTRTIVEFVNSFVTLDSQYQVARVIGKPSLSFARKPQPNKPIVNYPILGIFRDDVEELAFDLARFIQRVCQGRGVAVNVNGTPQLIKTDRVKGSVGDCVLLCSSPAEFDSSDRPRLPLLLRQQLARLPTPIQVFNPRGQTLGLLQDVQRLCGLILECIDPNTLVQNSITKLPQEVRATLNNWRAVARVYINRNPRPRIGGWPRTVHPLRDFIVAWQRRTPQRGRRWDQRISIVDLAYKLVTWLPNLQDDIEGLVYLEAIARTITEASRFSSFGSEIVFRTQQLEQSSVRAAIWDIFVPLASGAIQIDEDLLDTLPRDRLNILSIHQAKGLEFPLVIVDVGSDFRSSHPAQAFKRFPRNGGLTCSLEDELRPFSPLGLSARSSTDRAFDDLTRQYFVAYSRAQDVLCLVGLNSVKGSPNMARPIPNIATGWDRDSRWHWTAGLPNLMQL